MLRELLAGALAPGRAVRPDHLTGLDDLLEPAQVVVELLVRVLTEVAGHGLAELAARDPVAQRHVDLGAPSARSGPEPHLTVVGHVGVADRPPGDPLTGDVFGDLGVPLDAAAEGCARAPVRGAVAGRAYLVQVGHELRQALQLTPLVV